MVFGQGPLQGSDFTVSDFTVVTHTESEEWSGMCSEEHLAWHNCHLDVAREIFIVRISVSWA